MARKNREGIGIRAREDIAKAVVPTRVEAMNQLRQTGASLQQVGDKFGISREAVRCQLTKHYGSTKMDGLLTLTELACLVDCNRERIQKLERRGVIQSMTVNPHKTTWKRETVGTLIAYFNSRRCPVCQQPSPRKGRSLYCSSACSIEAHRYKNKSEADKRRQLEWMARWRANHPEQAKAIERRSHRKYNARKSMERYQTVEYVVWKKCIIPLGTVVRVRSCPASKAKVEWAGQVVEVPSCCVRRRVKELANGA